MQSCRAYPATTFTRSAADPLNLVGIVTPVDRRAAGNRIVYRNGIPLAARGTLRLLGDRDPETAARVAAAAARRRVPVIQRVRGPRLRAPPGIFALNLFVRAASVVSHLSSRLVPVRNRSTHACGNTEKSILWRPQSGRRPS